MGWGNGFKGMVDEIAPHGNWWFKVGTGTCESSDCCTGDLKASAPSPLGVTGEKADGRGRDLASLLSLLSLSAVFDFVTLGLSLLTGLSHPMSTSSVSSVVSAFFSSALCFSGLCF